MNWPVSHGKVGRSGRRQVSASGGEIDGETVKEMDGRAKEKGRRAKEKEDENQV